MAKKNKVPVVAIRQIVRMRFDEHKNYSYREIAEYLKSEFGIEVTSQAVGYLYRKHKDTFNDDVVAVPDENSDISTDKQEKEVKPLFKPKPPVATLSEPLFEKDEETDLKDYFS